MALHLPIPSSAYRIRAFRHRVPSPSPSFLFAVCTLRLPGAEPAGAPSVGVARNAFERVLRVVRTKYHWDAGLLHRLGVKPDAWKLDYLTAVARFVFAPQLAHRLDRLTQMLPAAREVHSHDCGLFGKPPGADTQDKPSVRVVVDRRGDLRGFDRIALRQQAYHSAELDPLRRLRRQRERNERVGKVTVELGHFAVGGTRIVGLVLRRYDEMLRDPKRFESEVFCFLCDCAGVTRFFSKKSQYADFHRIVSALLSRLAPHAARCEP